ncbi:MAG TPA: chromate transporter [Kutzneria sp.]|nr:chromate transporter [Kutzneria sp.]
MDERVGLGTILAQWGRIGCIGFGGPPTHILLLRQLCVHRRGWLTAEEFEDGIAATNLLPGPASTQLAIFCAWRLRGIPGALVGAVGFICPGLVVILALAALFLSGTPPLWVTGAAAGAGAAVAAVAVHAAFGLIPASWQRARHHGRWIAYLLVGAVATVLFGPWVVLALVGCGFVEVTWRTRTVRSFALPLVGGIAGGLPWVALKVGALSYGGGFVIIPLMQADAVDHYHWMTGAQFLNAVALGQITPGPVVQTVAVVGYAAGGLAGGLLASLLAFAPSLLFVVIGGPRFERLRASAAVQSFLDGAGPAAIGAIAGSAVPLGLTLHHPWQAVVLALAALWLLLLRRGVVPALLGAAALGVGAALAGFALG